MSYSRPRRTNSPERRSPLAVRPSKEEKRRAGRTTAAQTPAIIRAHGVDLDGEFDGYARQRLGFKLGKFALSVTLVTVRIDHLGGPAAAAQTECLISVSLPRTDPVVVTAQEAGVRAAFDRALDATERALRRTLDRRRTRKVARPRRGV